MSQPSNILLIGASRGLGLALAREWLLRGRRVVATARDAGQGALSDVAAGSDGRLTVETLDMTDTAAIDALRGRLAAQSFDLLFVNAAMAFGPGDRADRLSTEDFTRLMLTNTLSPMRLIDRLGDLVRPDGMIAVMSSSMGSVSLNQTGGWEGYRASKAALNTLMRSYAARNRQDRRALILMDPGWVRTDMGGAEAHLGIEESIPGVVDTLQAQHGRPGLKYLNYRGETVPW